jgi:lysophospholipase L1-like esterase
MMSNQKISRIMLLLLPAGVLAFAPVSRAQGIDYVDKSTRYLALGDSLAFGYNPASPTDLASDVGYADMVAQDLKKRLANASCPGETSGSILDITAPDFGCQAWRTSDSPMFINYSGAQMDYAVKYLKSNLKANLVTINIGGNDLALLQQNCNNDINCELAGLPVTLAKLAQNLTRIYSKIRLEAAYTGKVVALTYYAFDYNDPQMVSVFLSLNAVISSVSSAFNVAVADGFQAFYVASLPSGNPCTAGLLATADAPPGAPCGTHPNAKGHRVLADAVIAAANR